MPKSVHAAETRDAIAAQQSEAQAVTWYAKQEIQGLPHDPAPGHLRRKIDEMKERLLAAEAAAVTASQEHAATAYGRVDGNGCAFRLRTPPTR